MYDGGGNLWLRAWICCQFLKILDAQFPLSKTTAFTTMVRQVNSLASQQHRSVVALCIGVLGLIGGVQAATDPTRFSLEELMAMPVTGAVRYPVPQSQVLSAVSVVGRKEIQAFGWQTLADVLATLPAVYTTYDRNYRYLGVRGFGLPGDYNTRLLLTINGIRVNDPVYDQAPIGLDFPLDLSLVERIEFIPGPGGAMFGPNAMFGVINVVTRKGADVRGGELGAGWRSLDKASSGRLTLGKTLPDGTDILLSASGVNAKGQDLPLDFGATGISGVASGMDQTRSKRLFAQVSHDRWNLGIVHGYRYKADPTASYLSDPLVPGASSGDEYTQINFQFQDLVNDGMLQRNGRFSFGRYDYTSKSIYGSAVEMPASAEWQSAEMYFLSTALPDHKTLFGFELQNNPEVRQKVLYPQQPTRNIDINRPIHRIGVYVQDDWQLTQKIDALIGVRWDASNAVSDQVSPRIGLLWQPTDRTSVKAMFGRAYRNPNAFESAFSDGVSQVDNPSLNAEVIDTAEAIVDYRLQTGASMRVSVYHSSIRDLIVLGTDPATGLSQYQSSDHVDPVGIVLSVDKTWQGGARLRGSFAVRQFKFGGEMVSLNSPARLVKLLISVPVFDYSANLTYELLAETSRRTLNGTYLGGYGLSNIYLQWNSLDAHWDFGLGVANLTDKNYASPSAETSWQNALSQDRRSLRLQAVYKF